MVGTDSLSAVAATDDPDYVAEAELDAPVDLLIDVVGIEVDLRQRE